MRYWKGSEEKGEGNRRCKVTSWVCKPQARASGRRRGGAAADRDAWAGALHDD